LDFGFTEYSEVRIASVQTPMSVPTHYRCFLPIIPLGIRLPCGRYWFYRDGRKPSKWPCGGCAGFGYNIWWP